MSKKLVTEPSPAAPVHEAHESQAQHALIAMTPDLTPGEVIAHIKQYRVNHLIQRTSIYFDERMKSSAIMLKKPEQYFNSPIKTVFHSEKVNLKECDLTEFEHKFNSNSQKAELLAKFETYFKSFCNSDALFSDISLIIDELFTNVIYNAPSNDLENTSSGHARDGVKFELEAGCFGRIFAAKKDDCILIGCEDPYGTLNIRKMIERIHACSTLGADTMMKFGDGGAGIGCFLIFMNSMSLFVGVKKGEKTLFCSLIPLGLGDRKRNEMPKDFHCCEL